jgi:DNA-binding NtrC family response regulator
MTARRTSVLVVEDEILISNLIAEVLDESGFAVHAVADCWRARRAHNAPNCRSSIVRGATRRPHWRRQCHVRFS